MEHELSSSLTIDDGMEYMGLGTGIGMGMGAHRIPAPVEIREAHYLALPVPTLPEKRGENVPDSSSVLQTGGVLASASTSSHVCRVHTRWWHGLVGSHEKLG